MCKLIGILTIPSAKIIFETKYKELCISAMAECVMINKGDHTIEVIETLSDILQRIGGHHIKKRFTFRPLSIAENYINNSVQ